MDDTTVEKKLEAMKPEAFIVTVKYDVVTVSGEDALSYLQGQLSQDIAAIAVGQSSSSLLLQPQGKLLAWLRVYRATDSEFWVLVDEGFGATVLERLQQFKLRVKVELTLETMPAFAAYGTDESQVQFISSPLAALNEAAVASHWPGVFGADWFASSATPELSEAHVLEELRVLSGVPKMGAELDSKTIPAAAHIVEASVSFTKGCYVGQELVARIDSRGNRTPERLVKIISEEAPAMDLSMVSDAQLFFEDKNVGRVTSLISSQDKVAGLGYLKRAVDTPLQAHLQSADGDQSFAVSVVDIANAKST